MAIIYRLDLVFFFLDSFRAVLWVGFQVFWWHLFGLCCSVFSLLRFLLLPPTGPLPVLRGAVLSRGHGPGVGGQQHRPVAVQRKPRGTQRSGPAVPKVQAGAAAWYRSNLFLPAGSSGPKPQVAFFSSLYLCFIVWLVNGSRKWVSSCLLLLPVCESETHAALLFLQLSCRRGLTGSSVGLFTDTVTNNNRCQSLTVGLFWTRCSFKVGLVKKIPQPTKTGGKNNPTRSSAAKVSHVCFAFAASGFIFCFSCKVMFSFSF